MTAWETYKCITFVQDYHLWPMLEVVRNLHDVSGPLGQQDFAGGLRRVGRRHPHASSSQSKDCAASFWLFWHISATGLWTVLLLNASRVCRQLNDGGRRLFLRSFPWPVSQFLDFQLTICTSVSHISGNSFIVCIIDERYSLSFTFCCLCAKPGMISFIHLWWMHCYLPTHCTIDVPCWKKGSIFSWAVECLPGKWILGNIQQFHLFWVGLSTWSSSGLILYLVQCKTRMVHGVEKIN